MKVKFKLNGKEVRVEAEPNERLIYVLRRQFGLKSVKPGSPDGLCGSSIVLMNDKPAPSCLIPIFNVEETEIVTLEYFKTTEDFMLIKNCFAQAGVELCGYCDAGKIFLTYAIMNAGLDYNQKDFSDRVKKYYAGSLCRCTSLEDLLKAVNKLIMLPRRNKRTYDRRKQNHSL